MAIILTIQWELVNSVMIGQVRVYRRILEGLHYDSLIDTLESGRYECDPCVFKSEIGSFHNIQVFAQEHLVKVHRWSAKESWRKVIA